MRKIRYSVAMSLDGYIAGPKGEADRIIMDPEIDFTGLFEQFDTFLLGRRTFEAMGTAGQQETPGTKTFIFSRTLRQQDYPGVMIVAEGVEEMVAALRAEPGKDIWLFGGGSTLSQPPRCPVGGYSGSCHYACAAWRWYPAISSTGQADEAQADRLQSIQKDRDCQFGVRDRVHTAQEEAQAGEQMNVLLMPVAKYLL